MVFIPCHLFSFGQGERHYLSFQFDLRSKLLSAPSILLNFIGLASQREATCYNPDKALCITIVRLTHLLFALHFTCVLEVAIQLSLVRQIVDGLLEFSAILVGVSTLLMVLTPLTLIPSSR